MNLLPSHSFLQNVLSFLREIRLWEETDEHPEQSKWATRTPISTENLPKTSPIPYIWGDGGIRSSFRFLARRTSRLGIVLPWKAF